MKQAHLQNNVYVYSLSFFLILEFCDWFIWKRSDVLYGNDLKVLKQKWEQIVIMLVHF